LLTATKVAGDPMSLFNELKRRNVIRVAMAYVVASWLIIQVVETILPAFGYGDVALRYIVIFLAVAFIPTLVFSWAFEFTPEGLKREVDVDREHSITRFTGKRLDRIIMVLLALGLGYFAFDKFVLDPVEDVQIAESAHQEGRSEALTESYGDKSIAVLPFVNMSADPDQEYFSDGISEELLNLLSKIPGLRVISRSSSFSFKGKDFDIPTIATQLNVVYILEGSVRKDGNQVRITAQLIEARSDTHLWSETYDRELVDIFAIQDEISSAITVALKERLGFQLVATPMGFVTTQTAAASAEAHDAYLRGRHLLVQRTRTSIEGAVREFEKAIAIDSDYALAHAELAIATALLQESFYGDLNLNEAIARATPHAEQAMALDPKLAEAHAATGLLLSFREHPEKTLTHFEQAIQINPNYSDVHTWMAILLGHGLGLYEEAFRAREMALWLDPLSLLAINNYVESLVSRNRLDEARGELEKIVSIYPAFYADWKATLAGLGGKWANPVLGSLDILRIDPQDVPARRGLTWQFASIGLEKEALAISENTLPGVLSLLGKPKAALTIAEDHFAESPGIWWSKHRLGKQLASTGDYARARPILEEMWQRSGGRVTSLGLFLHDNAEALIAIYRDAGEEAKVDELVAAIRENVRHKREAGMIRADLFNSVDYEEGFADFIVGERKKGLALIAKGMEDGFFILPNEAYLQTLYDDPGFAPIIARQEDRQARERNHFLSIVCINNPYADVWQPAEGTCERFAAEQKN
jgi:TolB-like protein